MAPVMKSFRLINSSLLSSVSSGPVLNQGESHVWRAKAACLFHSHHSPFSILQDERKARLMSQWGLFQNRWCVLSPFDSGGKWHWDVNFQVQKSSCPSRHFLWKHQSIRWKEGPVASRWGLQTLISLDPGPPLGPCQTKTKASDSNLHFH